jgi:hypothetical protein
LASAPSGIIPALTTGMAFMIELAVLVGLLMLIGDPPRRGRT